MAAWFQPSAERIAVKRLESEKQTASGIIIPDAAQEKQSRGKVVSAGGKVDSSYCEGATVIFGKYAGVEVNINGEDLVVLAQDDVLGVVL